MAFFYFRPKGVVVHDPHLKFQTKKTGEKVITMLYCIDVVSKKQNIKEDFLRMRWKGKCTAKLTGEREEKKHFKWKLCK